MPRVIRSGTQVCEADLCELQPCDSPGHIITSTPMSTPHKALNSSGMNSSEISGSLYEPNDANDDDSEGSTLTVDDEWNGECLLVSRKSLWKLMKYCRHCSHPCLLEVRKQMGTFMSVLISCPHCQSSKIWNSQPLVKDTPVLNIKMAAAILFNGASPSKVFKVFDTMKVPRVSQTTYWRYQTTWLQPTVWNVWLQQQELLFDELRSTGGPLQLSGDSRSDSPGHSAQFGSYTVFENRLNKIIHFELIKVKCSTYRQGV